MKLQQAQLNIAKRIEDKIKFSKNWQINVARRIPINGYKNQIEKYND